MKYSSSLDGSQIFSSSWRRNWWWTIRRSVKYPIELRVPCLSILRECEDFSCDGGPSAQNLFMKYSFSAVIGSHLPGHEIEFLLEIIRTEFDGRNRRSNCFRSISCLDLLLRANLRIAANAVNSCRFSRLVQVTESWMSSEPPLFLFLFLWLLWCSKINRPLSERKRLYPNPYIDVRSIDNVRDRRHRQVDGKPFTEKYKWI